ncbi:MAG TPA: PAS domain-containing protein [Rhodocyclaceae bacterium]|nr:PAS domain-containing protein [Rhodocyclaceae bacterium]
MGTDPDTPVGRQVISDAPPPRPRSVRALLGWLVVACLVPGLVGAALLLYHTYRDSRSQLEHDTLQTARALVQTVDAHLLKAQVAAIGVQPDEFQSILRNQKLPPDRVAVIFDASGTIVARTHAPEQFVGQKGTAEYIQRIREYREGTVETVTRDGIPVVSSFSASPSTGWSVGIGIPRQALAANLLRPLLTLAAGMVGLFSIGLALAWFMGERIAASIRALTGPALALGAGEAVAVPALPVKEAAEVAQALTATSQLLSWRTAERDQARDELERHHEHLESQVAERTARLEQILDSAGEGIFGVDRAKRVTFANRAAAELLGWSDAGSMLGLDAAEATRHCLARGRSCHGRCAICQTLADGEVRRVQTESFARTDGRTFPVKYVVSPQRANGAIAGAVVVFEDASAERAAEEARLALEDQGQRLAASYAFMTAILNSLPSHVAILDPDGVIIEVNTPWKRFARDNGMPEPWTGIGTNYLAVCRNEGQASEMARGIEAVLQGRRPRYEEDYRCDSPDQKRWFRMRVTPLEDGRGRVVVSHDDITTLKRAEEALAESERFLKAVADNVPGMVGYWDADLKCRFANQHYLDWFGRDPEHMLGLTLPELLGPDLFARNESYVRAALAGERQTFERTLVKASGEVGHTWASYIPDTDAAGRVLGFYVLVADVTELKQAELRLKDLNDQLTVARDRAEAASRAKSEFVANMSHEIRTPMNAILGLARLLADAPLPDQERDYIEKIEVSARSLLGILNDILDFSKIEAGRLELEDTPFTLQEVLRNTTIIVSANARQKGIDTKVAVDPDVPAILEGDPLRLQQVLLNLAGNAVKFTERGEVVLAVRKLEETSVGVTLEFSVRDTGIGIPPEHLPHLFEAFSQADASTSRRYGGTGLGLAISSRLVTLMGGGISATSEPGRGSDFRFTACFGLERKKAPPAQAPAAGSPALAGRLAGLRVLLVEDNDINQLVAGTILRRAGAEVEITNDGQTATHLLAEDGKRFDAVLMDIQMPVMDGYEATRIIREELKLADLPIIAMTANAMASDREDSRLAGMGAHIAKPVDVEELISVLLAQVPGREEKAAQAMADEQG